MANQTTDAMYNSQSREIQMKYEIYFRSEPMIITRDDYLASSSGLEEVQSDSSSLVGKVSSNEITLSLYNDNRLFTPTNTESPLYGLIKKGVKIVAFGRVVEEDNLTEWDPLGTYYVTEWATSPSGLLASVTANDILYSVFDAPMPKYQVTKSVPIKDLYEAFFKALNVECNVDESITEVLSYGYIDADNKAFITDLTNGALALCYGNRHGGVDIISRTRTQPLRATLTDNDQIISIKTEQSIKVGYDGISVTRNAKQESSNETIVSLKDQNVQSGRTILQSLTPSKTPIVRLKVGSVEAIADIYIAEMDATSNKVNLTLENVSSAATGVGIEILGTYLETSKTVIEDSGSNLLSLNSNYTQTEEQANKSQAYLKRVVSNSTPTLALDIRGNFKLKLGDKIEVQSDRYKTYYTGIITRIEYSYEGHLTSSITLVDSALFEEEAS